MMTALYVHACNDLMTSSSTYALAPVQRLSLESLVASYTTAHHIRLMRIL